MSKVDQKFSLPNYEILIEQLGNDNPKVAEALRRAHENRVKHLLYYGHGWKMNGLNELLSHLDAVHTSFQKYNELRDIAFLIKRAKNEFEVAIDAMFSGMYSVVADEMRGVMEIQFLMRDFLHNPSHKELWLKSDETIRKQKFQPNHLRQREANRLGIDIQALPDQEDYKEHSQVLHVMPDESFMSKGISDADEASFNTKNSFLEIFEHGRRLFFEIEALLNQVAASEEDNPHPDKLSNFKAAWHKTYAQREWWFTMSKLASNNSSSGENLGSDE